MLKITVDVFSGRPNPTWTVDSETIAHEILTELAMNRSSSIAVSEMGNQLGFRGIIIETLDDQTASDYGIGNQVAIATGISLAESKSLEIGHRLINQAHLSQRDKSEFMELDENRVFLSELLKSVRGPSRRTKQDTTGESVAAAGPCRYETGAFNPDFWNLDNTIRQSNNCYNYARNKRTNTFAQPGRAHGYSLSISCSSVTQGALLDGAHRRFDCFPDPESPRWMMAMVIWPGRDYHWYREATGGFFGHKPGRTAARNTDDSGNLITSPETCNRGPYTDFCGRFYACNSMVIS